jgi:UDP-N-acetylglucosamine 2-epimerase (non-hydrolysing)
MILLSYGTRPEYIKIEPIIKKLSEKNILYRILFTGQHENLINNNNWDFKLTVKKITENRLDNILNSCLSIDEEVFNNVKMAIVQGDTTSALGISLSCMHRGIKVIHLEAGLRSYDIKNPYPEEYNRKLISQIADIHLCPTKENENNLIKENISENVFVVGNTALDNLVNLKSESVYNKKILITLHRRENHEIIDEWFYEIENLANLYPNYEFILPIHPNPNVIKHKKIFNKVIVVEPMEHSEMIKLLLEASLVITDSGGLQEECSFLNKKCLVCRKTTERQESLNFSSFLIPTPKDLTKEFNYHIKNCKINYISPYGDGYSSDKIINVIKKYL